MKHRMILTLSVALLVTLAVFGGAQAGRPPMYATSITATLGNVTNQDAALGAPDSTYAALIYTLAGNNLIQLGSDQSFCTSVTVYSQGGYAYVDVIGTDSSIIKQSGFGDLPTGSYTLPFDGVGARVMISNANFGSTLQIDAVAAGYCKGKPSKPPK